MKSTHTERITTDHGGSVTLEDVQIGDDMHTLTIRNVRDCLLLDFDDGAFQIDIKDGLVRFHRHCRRSNHDHDDVQSLQEWDRPDGSKEVRWFDDFPYESAGRRFFAVDFGPIRVDW